VVPLKFKSEPSHRIQKWGEIKMWEQIYGFNTATKAYVLTLINSVHGNLST
jgi:hypothetical protein